jgi:hypothetical protein
VNNPAFIEDSYQRHIINRMRDLLPYPEVPIRLLVRPRGQRTTEAALDELDETGAREAGADPKYAKTARRGTSRGTSQKTKSAKTARRGTSQKPLKKRSRKR